jgi:hypothetical protein
LAKIVNLWPLLDDAVKTSITTLAEASADHAKATHNLKIIAPSRKYSGK